MDFTKTDIVVVNTCEHDFPLFRKFLINNHHHFNKVHYVFSYQPRDVLKYDYSNTVMKSMPFANFIWADHNEIVTWRKDGLPSDFRDHATNLAVDQSTSDAILFLEPDILIGSIDYLLNLPNDLDIIAHCEDVSFRLSPSFIWTRRSLIDKTRRWFISSSGQLIFEKIVRFKSGPDVIEGHQYVPNPIPIKDRFVVSEGKDAADHFDQFSSELILQSTNAHFINHRSFDFWHLGGIIPCINHMRQNIYENVYELRHLGPFLENNLNCGVSLDPLYIEETQIQLQNIRKFVSW